MTDQNALSVEVTRVQNGLRDKMTPLEHEREAIVSDNKMSWKERKAALQKLSKTAVEMYEMQAAASKTMLEERIEVQLGTHKEVLMRFLKRLIADAKADNYEAFHDIEERLFKKFTLHLERAQAADSKLHPDMAKALHEDTMRNFSNARKWFNRELDAIWEAAHEND